MAKILKRLKKGCSNCGWDKTSCDIHHIIPKSKGGTNDHFNLTLLCPNCHRLAHENNIGNFINFHEYVGDEWKQYYYATKG